MEIVISVLIFTNLMLTYLFCLQVFYSLSYEKYLSVFLSLIFATTWMATNYTASLILGWNFAYLLSLMLLVYLAVLYKNNFIRKLKIVQDKRLLFLVWVAFMVFTIFTVRWGAWDAWSIWNLHAKFMYYPEIWTTMFVKELSWSHADYPLLFPAAIAMFWRSMHGVYAFVPASIALFTYLLILITIYSRFKDHIKVGIGLLILLMLDFNFVAICASQFADSLIACTYLIVMILMVEKPKHYLLVAGIICSLALSIKNEGYVLLLSLCLYTLLYEDDRLAKLKGILMGAAPLFLMALFIKATYAPSNDIMAGQSISTFDKLLDPYRYFHILRFSMETLFAKYYSFLIVVLICVKNISKLSGEYRILFFSFVIYLGIYLITPRELLWHMSTSMKRLFHHLYPAAIYIVVQSTDLTEVTERLSIKYLNLKQSIKSLL